MAERALNALVRAPKEVKRSEFVNYFMKNYKITREEAEETYDIYIERHRIEHDPRNKIQEKQLKDQEIKLILHERIQNNLPLEEYEKYLHLYNPLEFIKITGPISSKLKELAEPYRDILNTIITDNLQRLNYTTLLNLFTEHTNNTNELKGIYGLYLDMLAEKTNMELVNIYLEHDLNYFKDRDITLNKDELDSLLPNVLIDNIPRPNKDFIIDNKRYSYSAYLLKLLKKKEPKEQKPLSKSKLENPFGTKIKDGKLKIYSKGLKKPTFWREPGYYEVDLMQLKYENRNLQVIFYL